MNNKVIGLFIIILVAALTIGNINAADFENHNFDNYFSMKIPKDMSFEKEDTSISYESYKSITISYFSEDLMIEYIDSPTFSENSSAYIYQTLFESANDDLKECYETQYNGTIILETTQDDGDHISLAGISSGHKMVIIGSTDSYLVKQLARTVKLE